MANSSAQSSVPRIYKGVIDDVIDSVREAFLDENVDEQILNELQQHWEAKVAQSKAVSAEPIESRLHRSVVPRVHPSFTAVSLSAGSQHGGLPGQLQNAHGVPVFPPYQSMSMGPGMQGMPQGMTYVAVPTQARTGTGSNLVSIPSGAGGSSGQIHAFLNQQQPTIVANPGPSQGGESQATITVGQIRNSKGFLHLPTGKKLIPQLDGPAGGVSDDEDDEDDDEYVDVEDVNDVTGVPPQVSALLAGDTPGTSNGADEDSQADVGEPLNSEDDISGEDPNELFEADNVVVCQYDKVTRSRNRWRFVFKDGIMNLNGRDFVFQKASGEAEW